MKTKILLPVTAALFMAISFETYAQPEPPGTVPGPGLEARQPGPRGPRPARDGIRQVSTFTGEVAAWVTNDDFVYDAFYLQSNGEKILVKFPAAMGASLKTVAKTGNKIAVNGVTEISPLGEKTIGIVSITAGGKTFYDTPPAAPANPPAPEFITGNGKISNLQKNQGGDINGFILDNKTILRLPPHVIMQLGQAAVTGVNIDYTGLKKTLNSGEVSSGNYTIVHCQTITINGTQYLTR